MKKKIVLVLIVLLVVVGVCLLYFRLMDDNVPTEEEKRYADGFDFTNVPENPDMSMANGNKIVYWNNRDYAFFQDRYSAHVSYVVERIDSTAYQFEDESRNWTREHYGIKFSIFQSNYKDIRYVLGYQDAFYTFKDSLITRYDLKAEKIKKLRIDVNKVLGISNQFIYIKNDNGYFALSLDLKDKKSISKSKLPSKYKVEAVEYSFEVEKE